MSLKEKINLVKEQLGISEVDTQALEKALGKKLVDYESTEALVAALMGYYNGELKKKAASSHTHDDRYYTETEINTKLNGKANTSHTHTKANITDFPTSMKNPYALTISLNGTSQGAYDGAAAKSINITAGGVGAYTKTETDEKFKNFCPFPINSLYLSLGSENPSTLWLGTTWQKQEGRFLLGSSSSYSLGATGGASSIALSVANMPSHTHSASQSAHTHSQPAHTHKVSQFISTAALGSYVGLDGGGWTAYYNSSNNTSSAGGDTTGSATPSISIGATGSGTAFSILPPYLVVNIWKRLS